MMQITLELDGDIIQLLQHFQKVFCSVAHCFSYLELWFGSHIVMDDVLWLVDPLYHVDHASTPVFDSLGPRW